MNYPWSIEFIFILISKNKIKISIVKVKTFCCLVSVSAFFSVYYILIVFQGLSALLTSPFIFLFLLDISQQLPYPQAELISHIIHQHLIPFKFFLHFSYDTDYQLECKLGSLVCDV